VTVALARVDVPGFLQGQSPAAVADDLESESAGDALSRWAMTGSGYERLDWAKLMRRTLALDPLSCPTCGERLRPIAEITNPDVIERIQVGTPVPESYRMRAMRRPSVAFAAG
jgi:hypothetical protein